MDTFDHTELSKLLEEQVAPCISIYLPTHVVGKQGQQDPVRLKNLVQRAEVQLTDSGLEAVAARKLLQLARALPDDPVFWKIRSQGLAIFVASGVFHCYRLALAFDEFVHVGRRFYVKPLLPLANSDHRFFVLALSENRVRLYSATRDAIETVDVPGLPDDMESALNYESVDRGSQVHSGMRGRVGKQAAVFHGHGGEPDTRNEELGQFCRLIDSALQPIFRDQSAPMLLAGVSRLTALFAKVCSYLHVLPQALEGNCDRHSAVEVHRRAWPLVEPDFEVPIQQAACKYRELASTAKAIDDLRQIVPAARDGRIETLLIDVHATQWGSFNPQTGAVELHEERLGEDEELVDLAVWQSLQHGATVYGAKREQVPGGAIAAAVLRY